MTSPRDDDRIAHIVDACEQAASFVAGRTRDDVEQNRMLQLALVKLVEIIGEAAKSVSEDTRRRLPECRSRSRHEHAIDSPITTSKSTSKCSGAR
jgi:uncharacterized protein with HEPN domain